METKLSTKGQIVIPAPVRRKLGLEPGDSLDVKIQGEGVLLAPRKTRSRKLTLLSDPITGLPVLSAGKKTPLLQGKQVREILSEFP